jgi:hypothetical protein
MGINKIPRVVHRADAVRVAVVRQSDIRMMITHRRGQRAQIFFNRFGMNAAKPRIHFPANFQHLTARRRENRAQVAASRAVHRVHYHAPLFFADGLHIRERLDVFEIQRKEIRARYRARFQRVWIRARARRFVFRRV